MPGNSARSADHGTDLPLADPQGRPVAAAGSPAADELATALGALDGSFTRAEAGLRFDLAAVASNGRQRTLVDGHSQVRHAAALAVSTATWLRDEEADARLANSEL